MGEVQLWQVEGLGMDKETLEKVLRIFRSDGVRDVKSQQMLRRYIMRIGEEGIFTMYETDADTTLELLVECLGVRAAFKAVNKAAGYVQKDFTEENRALKAECERLRDELAHCKADLYDFYAREGKIPNYG